MHKEIPKYHTCVYKERELYSLNTSAKLND